MLPTRKQIQIFAVLLTVGEGGCGVWTASKPCFLLLTETHTNKMLCMELTNVTYATGRRFSLEFKFRYFAYGKFAEF